MGGLAMLSPVIWLHDPGLLAGQLAYIDPGTGSLIFQALVAGFLGAVMGLRSLRGWIALKLSKLFGGAVPTAEHSAADSSRVCPRTADHT
jgi:hypothetical protein